MKEKISLDRFRIIAAILIVAIHIFPLSSINETADFIFTHVICRIGVPFFLMITGFFVLPKAIQDRRNLIKYTIKIAKIYAICMIIYLPVNIYAGQLKGIGVIGIIKDIFINGTFYHLWYFPALILGVWVTYFIIKHCNKKVAITSILLLYIIGCFGDSYFGLSEKNIIISKIYNCIFAVADYTRNGLFYAPIFLGLGYLFSKRTWKTSNKNNLLFTITSLVLLIIEGLILHTYNLQKHDSMYFMLIPLMFSIFNFILLQENKENNKKLRNIATIIYIIHPMFIILIRGAAKVVHLENIMIDNSLINYILVVISSVVFSIIFETAKVWYNKKVLN
ncbi:MAG: acyltransferase family protein [Clostridia bacterium]|nr:acyltransferase family protein [Clostridia bacterium]